MIVENAAKPAAPISPALIPAVKIIINVKGNLTWKLWTLTISSPLKPIKPPVSPPASVPFFQSVFPRYCK